MNDELSALIRPDPFSDLPRTTEMPSTSSGEGTLGKPGVLVCVNELPRR